MLGLAIGIPLRVVADWFSGSWKDAKFKPYNLNSLGAPAVTGALHPRKSINLSAIAVCSDSFYLSDESTT